MQPYNGEEAERRYPEEDETDKKTPTPWTWTNQRIAIAAGSIVVVGFIAWFVMEYSKAKTAAIAKAAANATAS